MIEIRRFGAEVRATWPGNQQAFDRYSLEDCGVTTLLEIEQFCKAVREQGGDELTAIAVGRRSMWVIIPHPDARPKGRTERT